MSSIRNELKIFRVSVILSILNTALLVFITFVVNQFPRMKASPQCLCYNKAMLPDIASIISHRRKEIILKHIKKNIAFFINVTTALPIYTLIAFQRNCTKLATIKVRINSLCSVNFRLSSPSTVIAIGANHPDVEFPGMGMSFPNINTFSNIPFLWHNVPPFNTIISQAQNKYKGKKYIPGQEGK